MRARGPLIVMAGCGLAGGALSWFVAQHSLIGARWGFFVPVGVWVAVWVTGAWAAGRVDWRRFGGRRAAVVAILVLGGAARLAAASGTTPSVSNDLYRYGWDAHVQLSGIDPYRYPPSAGQLVGLRTPPYFPGTAECLRFGQAPGCTTLNRPSARTIYPPVAEAWFEVVHVVVPGGPVRQWQLAGAAVDVAALGLLMIGLGRLGREPAEAAWYAFCPIPVIEFAGNGHVDGLGLALLLAALLALRRGRAVLGGALIGLATMVKLYPAVAVVAAWRRGRWPMLAAFAAVGLGSYAPHVAVVGARVVGYLPGYLREEHYSSGGRFLLVGLLGLPPHALAAVAVGLILAGCSWVVRSDMPVEAGTAVLLAVLLLISTPVQPWYAVGLAALAALAYAALGVSAAGWTPVSIALLGELYYAAVILDEPHQVGLGRLCYGAALAGFMTLFVRAGRWRPPVRDTSLRAAPSAHVPT